MKQLFTQQEIDIQSKIVAKQINDKHRDDKTPVIFVGLLNGCFMFYSDFLKNITFDIECDFMRVKSYISKKKQGDVQITKDLETSIKGKHVYIIDDIYDTGNTINAVPNSFIDEHYNVFEINDEWVIGYGLDNDNGHCRNYNMIYEI